MTLLNPKAEVTFTSSFRSKSFRRTRIQMNVFVKKKKDNVLYKLVFS